MKSPLPIYENDELKIIKSPFSPLRSTTAMLNIILVLVICLFIFCFSRYINHENRIAIIQTTTSTPATLKPKVNSSRTRTYYDFEQYLQDKNVNTPNTTRRFFYVDLGCFDGRDIDYFLHFHSAEVERLGKLSFIAFEPDPINFSACKMTQQRSTSISGTVYDAAVWTESGKVRYAIEKGQKSKIDQDSALYVRSVDFSKWLSENFRLEDYVYIKFTIEGAEIPILEKMVVDETLALVDHMEIEWNEGIAPDLEPRRVYLECMFDNFGMDFLYMVNPVDLRHAFNVKDLFTAVPKDRGWRLKDPFVRFHYKTRKEVPALVAERLQQKQQRRPF